MLTDKQIKKVKDLSIGSPVELTGKERESFRTRTQDIQTGKSSRVGNGASMRTECECLQDGVFFTIAFFDNYRIQIWKGSSF